RHGLARCGGRRAEDAPDRRDRAPVRRASGHPRARARPTSGRHQERGIRPVRAGAGAKGPAPVTRVDRRLSSAWAAYLRVQYRFPGNVVYRLARRHILAVGAYYALEIADAADATDAGEATEGASAG